MSSHHDRVSELNRLAAAYGYRVEFVVESIKAPWYKFPVRTWTWGLVPRHDPKPRGSEELMEPLFSCSNSPLPTSSTSRKHQEFLGWLAAVGRFLRSN